MNFKIEDIQPTKGFILVKPFERPKETSTGLYMPEEGYSPTPVVGEVIAAGEGSEHAVGETVFFRRYSHDELKFYGDDGNLIVVNLLGSDEIVAKVKKHD